MLMFRGHLKIIILKALAESRSSGYGLMKRLQEQVGCKPSPGSLYPLLDELASRGLVSSQARGKSKVYAITAKGKTELRAMEGKRAEIFQAMQRNIRMWGVLSGEDVSFQLGLFERLSRGELPFGDLSREMLELKDTLAMIHRVHDPARRTAIRRVLRETTIRLRRAVR